MYRDVIKVVFVIVLLSSLPIFADIDMQKNMYDSAEEMIQMDEKMNRAIAQHNQIDPKEDAEMLSSGIVIDDFMESATGYILERNIPEDNNTKIKVRVEKGMIIISTDVTTKEMSSEGDMIHQELTFNSSEESLSIPYDADDRSMEKSYKNGILKIVFSKK